MIGRVERDLRIQMLDKLQRLSFGFYDRQRTGDLMSRATADVDVIANFLQSGFIHVTRSAVWFAAVAVIMLATNWRLGIISMSFLPLSVWILGALVMRIEAAWARVQRDTGRMTSRTSGERYGKTSSPGFRSFQARGEEVRSCRR